MTEENTGAEAQEFKAEDMMTQPFLEGNEPVELEIEKPKEEGESKHQENKTAPNVIADFLNEGIENEEEKMKFDDIIFSGKKEDGTEVPISERKGMLIKTILDNTLLGPNKEVDGYIRDILKKSSEPDFDINKYKEGSQQNVVDLSDVDTVVKQVFTQKYGAGTDADLTEEEITEKVSELSTADKKMIYADFKQAIQKAQSQREIEAREIQEKEFKQRLEKYNKDTETSINLFVEKSKVKDIYGGFKFGQSEKDEYINELPTFMKRQLEQNENKDYIAISQAEKELQKMIKDPESFMDLIPFLWLKSKGKLEGYSTMLSEQVKWDMLERLDNHSQQYSQSNGNKESSIDDMLNVQTYLGK